MKKQAKSVAWIVVGLLGAMLAGVGPAVSQEIKIGWIGPLSGWGRSEERRVGKECRL